jgi:hypothetical protein
MFALELPDLSSAWLVGLGALLAGVGSLLTGIAALRSSRKKGKEEAYADPTVVSGRAARD